MKKYNEIRLRQGKPRDYRYAGILIVAILMLTAFLLGLGTAYGINALIHTPTAGKSATLKPGGR